MDNAKAEKVLKRVEVVVPVKQRVALSQTKSSNDCSRSSCEPCGHVRGSAR